MTKAIDPDWRRALLPLGAALALAACGSSEEPQYEAGVTDEGGGEFIVTDETPAVGVDLPETAMTPAEPTSAPEDGSTPSAKVTPIEETPAAE